MLTPGSTLCRASTRERALEALAAFLESASLADDVLDRCSPVTLLLQRFAPMRAARHCCSLLYGLQAVQQASSVPNATLLEAVQSQSAWCRRDSLLLLCVRSVRSGGGGEAAALAARALALLAVTLGAGDASERWNPVRKRSTAATVEQQLSGVLDVAEQERSLSCYISICCE